MEKLDLSSGLFTEEVAISELSGLSVWKCGHEAKPAIVKESAGCNSTHIHKQVSLQVGYRCFEGGVKGPCDKNPVAWGLCIRVPVGSNSHNLPKKFP